MSRNRKHKMKTKQISYSYNFDDDNYFSDSDNSNDEIENPVSFYDDDLFYDDSFFNDGFSIKETREEKIFLKRKCSFISEIALFFLKEDKFDDFIFWVDRLFQIKTCDKNIINLIYKVSRNMGDKQKTYKFLEIGINHNNLQTILILGNCYFNDCLFNESIKLLLSYLDNNIQNDIYYEFCNYILGESYLKIFDYDNSMKYFKLCYKIKGKYSEYSLERVIDYCEQILNFDHLTEIVFDDIQNKDISIYYVLNIFFDKMNKEKILSAMVSNLSGYYLDKYFFPIVDYIINNNIQTDNKEILYLIEKVKKSTNGYCNVCIENCNNMIFFKELKRMSNCDHSFCFNCCVTGNFQKCPLCRTSLSKISYCNIVKSNIKENNN